MYCFSWWKNSVEYGICGKLGFYYHRRTVELEKWFNLTFFEFLQFGVLKKRSFCLFVCRENFSTRIGSNDSGMLIVSHIKREGSRFKVVWVLRTFWNPKIPKSAYKNCSRNVCTISEKWTNSFCSFSTKLWKNWENDRIF